MLPRGGSRHDGLLGPPISKQRTWLHTYRGVQPACCSGALRVAEFVSETLHVARLTQVLAITSLDQRLDATAEVACLRRCAERLERERFAEVNLVRALAACC
jgi:hypothetical protein